MISTISSCVLFCFFFFSFYSIHIKFKKAIGKTVVPTLFLIIVEVLHFDCCINHFEFPTIFCHFYSSCQVTCVHDLMSVYLLLYADNWIGWHERLNICLLDTGLTWITLVWITYWKHSDKKLKKKMFKVFLCLLVLSSINSNQSWKTEEYGTNESLPVVMWHGMGK